METKKTTKDSVIAKKTFSGKIVSTKMKDTAVV
jgi:ribosomal protein S17